MDMNITEASVSSRVKLLDTTAEQSIDTEFSIPDYYPEISKILKCLTDVYLLSRQVKDGAVTIGGQVSLTVLYTDSENGLNSFSHVVPFTKTVDADLSDSDASVSVCADTGYLNCKATAQRKVEVHGSVTMNITVQGVDKKRLIGSAENDGIYTRAVTRTLAEPLPIITKYVFVEDEIGIGQTKPPVAKILRSSASAKITECKQISGKTVVKGEVTVCVLYSALEQTKPFLLTEQRGFSQIVECAGTGENSVCDATAEVSGLELHPKSSLDGDVKTIAFEAKIGIDIYTHNSNEITYVTDAFSGKMSVDIAYSDVITESVAECIDENYVCKKSIDIGDGSIKEIFDLWCKPTVDYTSYEGNDVVIKGTVRVCIIALSGDGEPLFFERVIDYEYRYSLSGNPESVSLHPSVEIVAVNYSLAANGCVDIAVELSVKATVFRSVSERAVTQINFIDDKSSRTDNDTAIILYFPDNESVWEIARKYGTSPQKICEINGYDNVDCICNKTLLIPNI